MYNSHLYTLITAADCGSFHKAAEQLFTTPASVMNQINALEKHLGIRLFIRNQQGIRLTEAGASIYHDAKQIMLLSDEAIARARTIQTKDAVTIRIGSSLLNPCQELMDFWQQNAEIPNLYRFKIVPYSDDRNQMLSLGKMLGTDIDLLVGALDSPVLLKDCSSALFGAQPLCVAVPYGHDFYHRDLLSVDDLKGQHLMIPTQVYDSDFRKFQKAHPEILFEEQDAIYDIETFNYCEVHGYLLLTLKLWEKVHPALHTVSVSWEFATPYMIVYAKEAPDHVREFVKMILEMKKNETDIKKT